MTDLDRHDMERWKQKALDLEEQVRVLTADCSRYMADALGLREKNERMSESYSDYQVLIMEHQASIEELTAERQRSRLSEGLVERMKAWQHVYEWDDNTDGAVTLLRDILAEVTTEQETPPK
jgi:Spy/CpxP family protein refolding chaperone